MPADVSAITYFAPILAFFVVFIIVFAVLFKSKILGESKWGLVFTALVVASLFVAAAGVRRYVEVITPWFGALLVSLFFLLVLVGLVGGKSDNLFTGLKWFFVIAGLLVFIISGVVVFSDTLGPYLPGSGGYVGNPFTEWLYSPSVVGAILLIVITAIVSWVLVKAK